MSRSVKLDCQDAFGNECGTFWIYDLDDIEDGSADGISTPADFDVSPWKYQQDVSILLLNLEEATRYDFIYCYAEDDEDDGIGSAANKMVFDTGVQASQVAAIKNELGSIVTLDETPPTFTALEIQDPTAMNDRIVVSFEMNEPGTAYCRATRSDSGETSADMHLNRILSANWFSAYDGNGTQTITMTKLENVDPLLTSRDDENVFFLEATLYDVYCWARDAAVDTKGFAKPNYMTQEYVVLDVGSSSSPSGGRTANIWVKDSTPPTMTFIDAESLDSSTIQVTLQLDEPGTIWCQAMSLEGPNASICDNSSLQDTNDTSPCYYERFIKGSGQSVFTAMVPLAYRNVHINVDRLLDSSEAFSTTLASQTEYQVLCFAEDDWHIQASSFQPRSPSFTAPVYPNKVPLSAVHVLRELIGTKTTLDETPPIFTQLVIDDPTASNDRIVVTFALNEPGTAYCRATRSDSGETSADMSIVRILGAGWSAPQNGSAVPSVITMTKLENVDPALTNRQDHNIFFDEATQYDIYCLAKDDATDDGGLARPNIMTTSYIGADVGNPLSPQGGRTAGVWVADTTPPGMILVRAVAVGQEVLRITLQLDEPGTIWCQAAELANSSDILNCKEDEVQETNSSDDCFYEDFTKGLENETVFRAEAALKQGSVPESFRDVEIEVARIWRKDQTNSIPLLHASAVASVNFVLSTGPNKAPPTFTLLEIEDPTVANDRIVVTFALNEPGTAYCRPTRSDSGETWVDMHISRIVSAAWSSPFMAGSATIEMTSIANRSLDRLDNAALEEATRYDVYCWAEDAALDGWGMARPNLMSQVTLQLSEPGTVWCQAADPLDDFCATADIAGATSRDSPCYFETFIKGNVTSTFEVPVHEAYRNVEVEVSVLQLRTGESRPLEQQRAYNVFCYAEDDWVLEADAAATSVSYTSPSLPLQVSLNDTVALKDEIGLLVTLDESPPSFTKLLIPDPTAANDRIVVVLSLNEPGTAYCRATRSDSGETAADMSINRVIAAGWSAVFAGSDVSIEITKLENVDPSLTARDDVDVLFEEQTQYDVYCWAQDSAVNSQGVPRPNYMSHAYMVTGVNSSSAPAGGLTQNIWVTDSTPPRMIFVRADALASATLQVTLQLDEPGTIWCQAVLPNATQLSEFCRAGDIGQAGDLQSSNPIVKGNLTATSFHVEVPVAFRDASIDINKILPKNGQEATNLTSETAYNIACFAEDDWVLQADAAVTSVSYTSPSLPLQVSLNDTVALKDEIGLLVTLDESPPSFTKLLIPDPTAANDRIVVVLSLNEPGTAYCRATRSDSGETAADMSINRVIAAGWSAVFAGSDVSIEMTKLENVDPSLTARDDVDVLFEEQTQYDVYCWAQDSAVNSQGVPRPNYMSHAYMATGVNSSSAPAGGLTQNIWVTDSTPPRMIFVRADALASATLQVTLQLDEPGTIWCQVTEVASAPAGTYCNELDVQDWSSSSDCFFEVFAKASVAPADALFSVFVPEAFSNVDLNIDRVVSKDGTSSARLSSQHAYAIFCLAEDDWKIQADSLSSLPDYTSPGGPNQVNLTDAQLLRDTIGSLTTLDEAPPMFTLLTIEDPTQTNDRIMVTFALNEAGTAFCRPTRRDSGETAQDISINRIISAGWSAAYDGSGGDRTLEMTGIENVLLHELEPLVEAQQYDVYCWARDNAVDMQGFARPNFMTHAYVGTSVGNETAPSGGKIEAVWITDSTAPTLYFVRAGGVKTEAAEPANASSSLYCHEDEISTDPLSSCYWETFVKGSDDPATSFSAEVREAFEYVEVEVNRIWRKNTAASDPLLPETGYKVFCYAEDDWPVQAQSVYFNASGLEPQKSTLASGIAFKDAVGLRTTLDLTPPNITLSNPQSPSESSLTVLVTLSAWCKAVRGSAGSAFVPSVLEILSAGFSAAMPNDPYAATVMLTGEDATVPFVRGTDYEVFCYAEDDSCDGCAYGAGIASDEIAQTRTSIRTLDTTPPLLRVINVRSIARDQVQITIQADEGVRLWCAAWPTETPPTDGLGFPLNATNFEDIIKDGASLQCTDSRGAACGSFWVYDLDDLEDTSLDGLASLPAYRDDQTWRHNEDVVILLSGLSEQTEYSHIYCYAEDDEDDGLGAAPNKMTYDTGDLRSQVVVIHQGLGNMTTLDETPPIFTQLSIQDPTNFQDRIEIAFALNEPGTAYCRATRSDSGETGADMYISWIQTAGWSSAHDGSTAPSTIEIRKLENLDPLLTNRDDEDVAILEAQQYDIYCWALDSAVDTAGLARPNYMSQSYAIAEVNSTASPAGGSTRGVWVVDVTPPRIILVGAEAISSSELQVTLQLDEPGTVWCQPGDISGDLTQCQSSEVQNVSSTADCFWITLIQSNDFRADVHEAFVDVSINMNLLHPHSGHPASALTPETPYEIFCYAEDDWQAQANNAVNSINFVAVTSPNNVSFDDTDLLRTGIGLLTTLDESPPNFTTLAIPDPTVQNDRIVVMFSLNEAGTTYCRATRSDSGRSATYMTINRIISAGWSASNDGIGASMIVMTHLENLTALRAPSEPVLEATQYDVYCLAKDDAVDGRGLPRPNWMSSSYTTAAVVDPSSPAGGLTSGVWVVDSTPPALLLVDVYAASEATIHLRLQLTEPGTVWCAPLAIENTTFCTVADMTTNGTSSGCDYETFVKNQQAFQVASSVTIPEPYRDFEVKVDRIFTRDELASYALETEKSYSLFCFAQDDWPLQAAGASTKSPSFVAPTDAMKISLSAAQAFSGVIGNITTLDETPPSFTVLHAEDPTISNDRIVIVLQLNEPGTAYCRATRADSGEAPSDMNINRILTANWLAQNDGLSNSSIEITQLENVDPLSTSRDDEVDLIAEATQYDVYCWAEDSAVDSYGNARHNYVRIEYTRTDASAANSPQGGRTPGVWVRDTTPPRMTFVRAEGISQDSLQVTLQLDEPGTVWCAAVQTTADPGYCIHGSTPGGSFSSGSSGPGLCEYEAFVKGDAVNASFREAVHEAGVSVQVEINQIIRKDLAAADPLIPETGYHIYCFAEDDWPEEAAAAAIRSQSYTGDVTIPNKVSLEDVLNFSDSAASLFVPQTLDEAPPSFTLLQIQDPSALNKKIEVVFALNEAGTAYCRPVRADSAEAASPLGINRIISAGWSATHDPSTSASSSLLMAGVHASPLQELDEARQYDVYCWAQDEAKSNFGFPRPQYMLQSYVSAEVRNVTAPQGGKTANVWTVDSTAPTMLFIDWDAVRDEETLQVTLQLDEPGTVWCQAAEVVATNTSYCGDLELQDADSLVDCYFESYIKGNASHVFKQLVPAAFQDVEVEVNLLPSRDAVSSVPLRRRSGYKIFCFAEDDWTEKATSGSINFVAPAARNKVTLGAVMAFKDAVGTATTLDLTPPNMTVLNVVATEDVIVVSVSMDEAGTVWCRAYRKGAAVPGASEILETGFYLEASAEAVAEVNITAENAKGDPLSQGTDYEVYCFAQDIPCLRCSVAAGSTAQEIADTQTGIRTLDVLPPRVTVLFAEALSKDTIQLTLQVDEGATLWCAAWDSEPAGMSTNFEALIKGANCTESYPPQRPCGSFLIYDLDDLEDSPLDGVSTVQEFEASYQSGQDVQLSLFGLTEATVYSYVYCYAEDDEGDGLGSNPNKMYYDASDAPAGTASSSMVSHLRQAIGAIATLDESPPTFTQLSIVDPTVEEGVIVVSLALNEPGTAYCRVTRSDSGEAGADMHVNRILAADWSAVHPGPPADAVIINITALDRATPLNVPSVPVEASTQYDVYCWAQDNAVSTMGFARPNYMTHQYVTADVVAPSSPSGGATAGVWVTDNTPPTLIYVSAEAVSSDTVQVTLQLDEPGTIWCAAAELDTSVNIVNCKEGEVQDAEPDPSIRPCYFETFAKGTYADGTVFKADVSQPFRDVDIEVNRIWERNGTGTSALQPETPYKIFCYAEDDWVVQSTAAMVSPNFVAPAIPNKSPLTQGQSLLAAIGTRTTLDETPPRFTKLLIQNPTHTNDRIVVIFALNEPGTAYCRARRVDSGAASTNMKIPDILAAGWSASFSGTDVVIEMTKLSKPDPAIGALDAATADFDEQTQYDVFCWAHDDAVNGRGYPRQNQQTEEYVNTDVGQGEAINATLPGGKTQGVWVADTTPPTMLLVQAEALRSATLQVRLQLNEPGTVWCAATETGLAGSDYCLETELQSASSSADCFFEDYIKGNTTDGTSFSEYVPEAFQDVDVEITRILRKDLTAGSPLLPETMYQVFCFAEDDWKIQADSVNSSAEYVSPAGPKATTFATVQTFADSIGTLTTLDEAAPSFIVLQVQDPSDQEGILVVNFALNEAGTAYCRATRSDSGESAADMPINRVLTANWVGEYDGTSNVTIAMNNLENVDPLATKRDDEVAPLSAGTQYDIYCWAKDAATTTFGYPRPNYMAASYVASPVLSPDAPAGGYTKGVWVTDSTPPEMFLSSFDALSEDSLLVQLQLSEPGTVWCAATAPDGGSSSYCRPSDLQDVNPLTACYYEDYIKGSAGQGTTFMKEVSDPYMDVSLEINRIALSGIGGSGTGAPLPAEHEP
ncbi:unnamed protein product [Symbiodinium natans]|uniref:Uncharacterized protein n=1 Tax=Symbiodinium natans TaxID=878477 RepID=A0A812SRC9_9DINO|nr:unnamed protein product [Symbiodinium natans]